MKRRIFIRLLYLDRNISATSWTHRSLFRAELKKDLNSPKTCRVSCTRRAVYHASWCLIPALLVTTFLKFAHHWQWWLTHRWTNMSSWSLGRHVRSQPPSDSAKLKQAETSVKAHCGTWRITVFIALREPGRMGSSPCILVLPLLIWGPWRLRGKERRREGKNPNPYYSDF